MSWYWNVSILDLAGAKDDGGDDDNWTYKMCKAPVKSSPLPSRHPAFYRPDALPVAQSTMSKHWREKYHVPWTWSPRGVFHSTLVLLTTKDSWLPCVRVPSLSSPLMSEPTKHCHIAWQKFFAKQYGSGLAINSGFWHQRVTTGLEPSHKNSFKKVLIQMSSNI